MKKCTITLLLGIMLCCMNLYGQSETARESIKADPGDVVTFDFNTNKSNLDPSFMDNKASLDRLAELLSEDQVGAPIDSIVIIGSSSPEGVLSTNLRLSNARAESLKKYIIKTFPEINPALISVFTVADYWVGSRPLVAGDPDIPGQKQFLSIIDNPDLSAKERDSQIKSLEGGKSYRYFVNKFINKGQSYRMRYASVYVMHDWSARPECEEDNIVELIDFTEEPKPVVEEPEPIIESEPVEIVEPVLTTFPKDILQIKVNGLYLLAGVTNIGVELRLSDKFSLDVPYLYSPYTISKNYRLRFSLIQPSVRYWIAGEPFSGHFLGARVDYGVFNISLNDTRYQSMDRGRDKLWGFGIDYGYAFKLSNRWNMEFTIGAGYFKTNYDKFYNIENGAWFGDGTRTYWGITKAGVNISYVIFKR